MVPCGKALSLLVSAVAAEPLTLVGVSAAAQALAVAPSAAVASLSAAAPHKCSCSHPLQTTSTGP
eukprot:1525516-Pyramimonas_sp.AAC.1